MKARVSEMSAWLISLVLFLMLFLSVFQIRWGQLWQPEKLEPALLLENSYLTAAGFGGICALPLVLPEVEKTGGWKKRVYASLGISSIFLLMTYFAGFGIFGAEGMGRLNWPVISLMSSVNLPGMFLQRWDILLTGLLLISLFLSAGSGIFYMENILMTLKYGEDFQNQNARISGSWRKRLLHRKRRNIRIIALAAVYFLILQMRNLETAVRWYEEIGLLFCVPVMTGMILFIWWRKHYTEKKNRREMHGAE